MTGPLLVRLGSITPIVGVADFNSVVSQVDFITLFYSCVKILGYLMVGVCET